MSNFTDFVHEEGNNRRNVDALLEFLTEMKIEHFLFISCFDYYCQKEGYLEKMVVFIVLKLLQFLNFTLLLSAFFVLLCVCNNDIHSSGRKPLG